MLSYILWFLVALLIHELGHCVAAFACKVTVSEFGFGWGRKLCGLRVRGVDLAIRLLPAGAYVRLNLEELQARPIVQQVLVLSAGIIVNLLAGVLTSGTHFSLMNYLLAATNILPLYQQDGWKCGMVILRASMRRKSPLIDWTFTIAGSALSLALIVAQILSRRFR
jgi:membrane-associated protease RseP (regulator of RpoE activity)